MSFGYRNWGDDSDDMGEYATSSKRGGANKSSRSRDDDAYNFDLSNDDEYNFGDSPVMSHDRRRGSKVGTFGNTNSSRRISTDERTKEILERNKKQPVTVVPDIEEQISLKAQWEGLGFKIGADSPDIGKSLGNSSHWSDDMSPPSINKRHGTGTASKQGI